MKKSRYYPFERNRYFYGKLLTVRDFESEQKYFNDKRRLLNRLLYGAGIVSGMQVVAVDDKSVSVEMGVAMDYAGREIVIPSPVTLKLSMLEGFTNNEYKKNVYLCVAYDEKGKEPVHSIANTTIRSEEVSEYNRVLESYRLFVREEAPDPAAYEQIQLTESIATIYQDANIRIYQRMPKYVNPEQIFEVTLVVEKTLQTPKIAFECRYTCDGFTAVGDGGDTSIAFAEPGDGQETEYTMTYALKAANRPDTTALLRVLRETAKLTVGDQRIAIDTHPEHRVEIIQGSIMDRISADYFDRSLDQSLDSSRQQGICLAKISLLQMGPTYIIDKVDRVPFGEYIYNATMLQMNARKGGEALHHFYANADAYGLPFDREPELKVDYNPEHNEFKFQLGVPKPQMVNDEIATGSYTFSRDPGAKTGFFTRGPRNLVSDEIEHQLGSGQIYIMVGLEESDPSVASDLLRSNELVYYGASEVFRGSPFEASLPSVTFGTVVYPAKGSFRIGMRLNQDTDAETIKVRWWAFKKLIDAEAHTLAASEAEQAELEAAADKGKRRREADE
ncbi:hypothetical protein IDH44_22055 [Paenibacillus sp. IB182496]|uniref:Uncharacterized protein n=1 Tax=Paenibacillus sabuli TaxID=2772509 RepID=A0A927BW03_9BACL|nr:hypothetical protein [Paenibacillus sabuli]MBD2847888.1 hypothetical protein [Paenibacillus sabuli]